MTEPSPTLDYQRQVNAAGVLIEQLAGGGVQVILATKRRRIATLLANAGHASSHIAGDVIGIILAIVVFPFYLAALALLASSKPRGIIRVDRNEVFFEERLDDGFGWTATSFARPRKDVTEFRANRFVASLYFRIAGSENFDVLCDLDEETITQVSAAINDALRRLREEDATA